MMHKPDDTPLSFNKMGINNLSEGWVNFVRYQCKEGYIDKWVGDKINNPNLPTKSHLQLNAFTEYFRVNGGEWFHKNDFKNNFSYNMNEEREFFTAEEIFKANKL